MGVVIHQGKEIDKGKIDPVDHLHGRKRKIKKPKMIRTSVAVESGTKETIY